MFRTHARSTAFSAVVALAGIAACAKVIGLDAVTYSDDAGAPGADDGGSDVSVDATLDSAADVTIDAASDVTMDAPPGPPCASDAGPTMVHVIQNGLDFCIDSTEISTADYAAFAEDAIIKNYDSGARPGICKHTIQPFSYSTSTLPVVAVDACNAYAYCAWAGKRLCGGTTFKNGSGAVSVQGGEWQEACLKGSIDINSVVEAGLCNVFGSAALSVARDGGCVGSEPGLYDMVGNVAELVVEVEGGTFCDAGDADGDAPLCARFAGRAFGSSNPDNSCAIANLNDPNAIGPIPKGAPATGPDPYFGFRCCKDSH